MVANNALFKYTLIIYYLFSECFIFMNMKFYKSFRVLGSNTPGLGGGLESCSDTDQQQQQLASGLAGGPGREHGE